MPASTPPFDMSAIGDIVGKIAGDARKNMEKWWYPNSAEQIKLMVASPPNCGLREYLYTSFVTHALKKDKSIFRKASCRSSEHLEFSSDSKRMKFLEKLKGRTFHTLFDINNSVQDTILIMDHGFVHLCLYEDGNMHILEYDAISFDPKFITAHFNR